MAIRNVNSTHAAQVSALRLAQHESSGRRDSCG